MRTTAPSNDSSPTPFRVRLVAASAALVCGVSAFGCGKPFNVKTQPSLPAASYAAKATVDSVAVEAQAVTDEDFLYETFDANLISAGVLPVRMMLTNSGAETVDFKSARFEVQSKTGRFKAVNARKAFKRLISYYGISAYSKSGYKESIEAFAAYALDVVTPLAGGQSRQGLMFFLAPSEAARQTGLTMIVGKLNSKQPGSGSRVELKLN